MTASNQVASNMHFGLGAFFIWALPLSFAQLSWILNQGNKIRVQEVHKCKDQGTGEIVWDLRLNRVSRKELMLEGNISMEVPLDNNVRGNMIVAQKGNGGWLERAFVYQMKRLCVEISVVLLSGWSSFWSKAGLPAPVLCPIPKGNYAVKNYSTAELNKNIFPKMKAGVFKIELEFLSNLNNKRLGCIFFILDTSSD